MPPAKSCSSLGVSGATGVTGGGGASVWTCGCEEGEAGGGALGWTCGCEEGEAGRGGEGGSRGTSTGSGTMATLSSEGLRLCIGVTRIGWGGGTRKSLAEGCAGREGFGGR